MMTMMTDTEEVGGITAIEPVTQVGAAIRPPLNPPVVMLRAGGTMMTTMTDTEEVAGTTAIEPVTEARAAIEPLPKP